MTQIKLRRDTSAAFASSNPILGNGEPAYETDTKKLKIGDGTTAYTQLEYFSAGGGGSTNISATLPLKIVDGVISLEVDGQTIQIVDGKLHANLDELSNEVNSLTGEVTDLSGRVTTVEGEVAKKEDEITALEPITLEKKVISNLNGMLYTSDGTRLYAQSITQLELEGNWVGPHITYNNPVSYIDIPLDINKDQVITIPRFRTSYSYSEATTFMLGSYDANGLFYPIFFQAKGNSNNGLCWLISNNYPEAVGTTYLNGSGTSGSYFGALNVSSDKVYIQAKYDESSGFYIRTFGAYPDNSSSEGLQVVYTNPADIERLRQITACRFINMGKMNNVSTAISVTLFGRYDDAHLERGTLPDLTNIPNSFSLTDVQSLNYIQLNLGDGLSVVDGKLTSSSTAPTNMVTTDTSQDITGQKSFTTGKTTFKNQDSNRKILGEINGNGAYCNYYTDKASGEKPCYLGKVAENTFNMGIPGLTRVTGRIFANTLTKWNGSNEIGTILSTDNLGSYVDGTTITYTNNKLTASGGGSAPSNMVTTDTAQTISGDKEFTGITTISNDIKIPIGKKITTPDGQWLMQLGTGFIGIGTSMKPLTTYDNSNYYLHNKSVIAGDGIQITEPSNSEIKISSTGGAAMPSNKYIDLTLGASGNSYTAPANGYFSWSGMLKGTVSFFELYNEAINLGTQSYSSYNSESGIGGHCFVPVSKGDVVTCGYYTNASLTTKYFRFIYAQGEV